MRTTKRFTPDVLDRYRREGRGGGTYSEYIPWHRVSRGDPASIGRSHLMTWRGRHRNLLSDREWVTCLFALMTPGIEDIREQFPLRLESSSRHELYDYDVGQLDGSFAGTLEIAERLGYRHPKVNGNGRSSEWVMSTDLLLMLDNSTRQKSLLAVSCKPIAKLSTRSSELLAIERAYWSARRVDWLLITPAQFDESVELTLRNSFVWGMGTPSGEHARSVASRLATECEGLPLQFVLSEIADALSQDFEYSQRAFWQSVWCGELTLDLRRGWRPHIPVALVSVDEFHSFNPIAARRTAWI